MKTKILGVILLLFLFFVNIAYSQGMLIGTNDGDYIVTDSGDYIGTGYGFVISANDVTISYAVIDCEDATGAIGITITGTGFIGQNLTVVRCPGGAFVFNEDATLTNSIGISVGDDISIASGKTVTGTYNLFGDAAKAGDGTYSDGGSTTLWGSNPLFVNSALGNYKLKSGSPAINAGTDVSLTTDYAGRHVPHGTAPDIGAMEFYQTAKSLSLMGVERER